MMSRTLGVCSWSLKPLNPRELVSSCKKCEIDAIQLALLPLIHDSDWCDCVQILQDSGITILSGMFEASGEDYSTLETIAQTGGLRQDETWPSTKENAKRVADLAAELEIPLVTFHAGFFPEIQDEEWDKMFVRLALLSNIFSGTFLGLETGQEEASSVRRMLECSTDYGNLVVNFDPANMILYGKGDPIKGIRMLAPRVKQVHIKDAKKTEISGTWGTETPMGDGDVPWKEFLQCVPEDVNLVIEREGGDTRIDDVKRAKAMLEQLGVC